MYNFLPYFFSNIDIGNLVGEIEMSDLKKIYYKLYLQTLKKMFEL